MTEEAKIGGAGRIVRKERPAGRRMRVMTADAGQFPTGLRRVGLVFHRVVIAEAETRHDVPAGGLLFVTGSAEFVDRLKEQRRVIRSMGAVTGHAHAGCHGRVNRFLREATPFMAGVT